MLVVAPAFTIHAVGEFGGYRLVEPLIENCGGAEENTVGHMGDRQTVELAPAMQGIEADMI